MASNVTVPVSVQTMVLLFPFMVTFAIAVAGVVALTTTVTSPLSKAAQP